MKRINEHLAIAFAFTWSFWWADAILVKFASFRQDGLIPTVLLKKMEAEPKPSGVS